MAVRVQTCGEWPKLQTNPRLSAIDFPKWVVPELPQMMERLSSGTGPSNRQSIANSCSDCELTSQKDGGRHHNWSGKPLHGFSSCIDKTESIRRRSMTSCRPPCASRAAVRGVQSQRQLIHDYTAYDNTRTLLYATDSLCIRRPVIDRCVQARPGRGLTYLAMPLDGCGTPWTERPSLLSP
ncbi:hypothetical protein VTK56DRAFT_2602 [Thermocarpiscus australiensis]